MNKNKQAIATVLTAVILVLSFVTVVSAQTTDEPIIIPDSPNPPSTLQIFWNNLIDSLRGAVQPYSVVGSLQSCDANAKKTWPDYSSSSPITVNQQASSYCTSGHGLFNVYTDGGNTKYGEYKDSVNVQISAGSKVELYCCPKAEPTSQSSCPSGTTFKSVSCTANSDSRGGYWCGNEGQIPYTQSTFNYCTPATSITCYFKKLGTCSSSYSNTYSTTQVSSCSSQNYEGAPMYSSIAACNGASGCSIDRECASGKTCQSGTCATPASTCKTNGQSCLQSGATCCSGLTCQNGGCYPPATSETCSQKGGVYCSSSQSCSSNGFVTSSEGPRCCMGTCTATPDPADPSTICVADGGTKVCEPVKENERTLLGQIQIYDLSYGDATTGAKITNFTAGQMVKVNFKVKVNKAHVLQNDYLTEVGIIPLTTAEAWGMNIPSGGFSIFPTFAIEDSQRDACCNGQSNMADSKEGNDPGFPKFWDDGVTTEYSFNVKVPTADTKDLCGSETYWDGKDEYVLYVTVKNGCYKDGFRKNVFISKNINLNTEQTTSVGSKCNDNFDCVDPAICQDIDGDFSWQKYCVADGTGGTGTSVGLSSIKKIALTREDISTATDQYLFASACLKPEECIAPSENYTVKCNSLQSLVDDGTLTETKKSSFFKTGGSIIGTAGVGAGIGFTVCSIAGWTAAAATAPATAGASTFIGLSTPVWCAAGGALTGAALGNMFAPKDTLVAGIQKSDANKVGICTAEEDNGFDFGGFVEKVGKSWNFAGDATTSGWIIIGGILFLFVIFFLGGKK